MDNDVFKKMENIIDEYWGDFQKKINCNETKSFIVKPSIPIIWFGDLESYFKKENRLKIVTVALNPSVLEFKNSKEEVKPNIALRFEKYKVIKSNNGKLSAEDKKKLYTSFNEYFNKNPYDKWFNNFEKILNSLDATYGGKMNPNNNKYKYTAIHIDLFSAIATDPTWGKLKNEQKKKIKSTSDKNFNGFKDLINILQPDIILISVAQKIIKDAFKIDQNTKNIEMQYTTKDGIKKTYIKIIVYSIKSLFGVEKEVIVLFGTNFRGTVFGGMSDDWKKCNIPKIIKKIKILLLYEKIRNFFK